MSETGHEERAARAAPRTVACTQCRKEIPASAATSAEGADYVRHFCGNECLARWQHSAGVGRPDKP